MRPVHYLAQCNTCGKVWSSRNAVAVGVSHSRKTGHEVAAEVMLSGRWVGGEKQ